MIQRAMARHPALALAILGVVVFGCDINIFFPLDSDVATVVVDPANSTMTFFGETVAIEATALNSSGSVIEGKAFTWTSSDPLIATVVSTHSSAGEAEVTAIANGTATITATAQGISGEGNVTVSQVVATVQVSPATHRLESQGTTVQLAASAQDARGNEVVGASFTWSSSDADRAAVDATGIVSAVDYGSVTITAMADGASGSATINLGLEVPTNGLMAAWLFNGNANDESGNGNDGVVSGATLSADRHGNAESAYSFDGVDDRISIGAGVKPPFPFAMSAWVKSNAEGTSGGIFRNDTWDPNNNYHGIHVTISFKEGIAMGQGSGIASESTRSQFGAAPGIFTLGDWRHIVVVFAAFDDPRFFVDNVEYPIDEAGGSGSTMTYSSDPGFIGNRWVDYLDGLIDDVRVYTRVLTEDDVEALFYEGQLKP